MRHWSLAVKLYLLLIPLLLAGIAVGIVARSGLDNNATEVIRARQVKELAVSALALLLTQDDATKTMLLDPEKLTEEAARKIAAYDAHLATLTRMQGASSSPEVSALIEQLGTIDRQELRPTDSRILEALAAGKIDEAKQGYFRDYQPGRARYEALVKKLGEAAESAAAHSARGMEEKNQQTFINTMLVLLAGILVVSSFLVLIIRHIRTRLLATVQVLEAMAERDLTQRLHVTSKDELGRMAMAVNHGMETMEAALYDMHRAAENTNAASQQLAAATEQLSTDAQQQASLLEETVASLEEMSGTIRQNAESAQQANQLALGSRDVAQRGGQVVTTAITAMSEINQSSKKIADIITVIDEIAFQTTLLALNAAVEAARAGEQGRGFAVVAAEIRNLSHRSATAAKEIKSLIQDSTAKVRSGSELVSKSGQTLEEIVGAVKQVTDIVGEIAVASREQASGIEQVNKAVTQMDHVTQSNSAQAEELSATAQLLTVQAEQLQLLVSRFKLNQTGQQQASWRAPQPRVKVDVVEPGARAKGYVNGHANGQANGFEEF
jgi:methyl-accepting chemotaxis protein